MPPRTPTRLALGGLPGRDAPTALEVAPDGRLLVAGQTGKLFAVAGGAEDAAPALDPPARLGTAVERGLLGVTLGPDSAANGCVYGVAPPGDSCSVGPGVYGVYCCR